MTLNYEGTACALRSALYNRGLCRCRLALHMAKTLTEHFIAYKRTAKSA